MGGSGTLEALVFDVDGTLADTERDGHRVAFNRAFEEFGLDWHWDDHLYARLLKVTGGKERIACYIDQYLDKRSTPADVARLVVPLHQCKTRHYLSLLEEGGVSLRPGVARLLSQARHEGLRLAIATTTTAANVDALIASTLGADAGSWFEVIGAGDVVEHKKPAPDIYHFVLRCMGLDAHDCIAIEDSANGLGASLGAGLSTVVTSNDYTRDENFAGAALVVDQLGEQGSPPRVFSGSLYGSSLVDSSCLRSLHAAWRGAA